MLLHICFFLGGIFSCYKILLCKTSKISDINSPLTGTSIGSATHCTPNRMGACSIVELLIIRPFYCFILQHLRLLYNSRIYTQDILKVLMPFHLTMVAKDRVYCERIPFHMRFFAKTV